MGDLVDQYPHLRVRGLTGVDDDPLALRVAPPARGPSIVSNETVNPSEPANRSSGASRCSCESPLSGSIGGSKRDACSPAVDLRTVEHRHRSEQRPVSPVSSPVGLSRSLTGSGAMIPIALSPFRT